MKHLFIILLFIGNACFSQEKKLIADETYLIEKSKSFVIECSNDSITKMIIRDLQKKITSVDIKKKTDRHGGYWLYKFSFAMESYNDMVVFINKINKS